MAEHSYTSRGEVEQYGFHPAVSLLLPVAAVLLGAMLPRVAPSLIILNFPLMVVIFLAVSRRNPILGAINGTLIGLFQDALTAHPLGLNGISEAIIGYVAASIGFAVDVDNLVLRFAMVFLASLVQTCIQFLITRFLMADRTVHLVPLHELLRAVCNAAVAVPLFAMLDRFRQRD